VVRHRQTRHESQLPAVAYGDALVLELYEHRVDVVVAAHVRLQHPLYVLGAVLVLRSQRQQRIRPGPQTPAVSFSKRWAPAPIETLKHPHRDASPYARAASEAFFLFWARESSSGRPSKKPEREAPPLVILNRSLRREPLDTIFDEIDLLEDDPPHRGIAMQNALFRLYWIQAEEKEWQGLWERGVFKKWSRKDLLSNDRVFTSRYVYKLKRSAITGEVYRFKARLIVRGFQMEKGVDFAESFSPTPGLAVGRFMLSLAVANDYELHACDIEQAFLQADKLPEGVNGRYFIPPPPASPDADDRDVVYEVRRPLYGNPSSPRALHKTLDAYFLSEGIEHVGFEESVWVRPKGGKYGEDIYVSTHVDDCLICCKSTTTMKKIKQELLTRFQGTDEGEVKEYLGCEVIRDRVARTGKMVQAGYAERVLRTFRMWDCNPVLTPLHPNVRLMKRDSPEVVGPRLHRRMRSIVGCLSYLVNMTRPDLAFTYSQLSKFVQAPGPVHLAAAERALAYLRGTYNEGITYCDPG
jgi:hypothetical protein